MKSVVTSVVLVRIVIVHKIIIYLLICIDMRLAVHRKHVDWRCSPEVLIVFVMQLLLLCIVLYTSHLYFFKMDSINLFCFSSQRHSLFHHVHRLPILQLNMIILELGYLRNLKARASSVLDVVIINNFALSLLFLSSLPIPGCLAPSLAPHGRFVFYRVHKACYFIFCRCLHLRFILLLGQFD